MELLKNKLAKRLAIAKSLGFIFGLVGFIILPFMLNGVDIYMKLGILFWYTTFGGIVGLMGFMDKHPAMESFKFPWWFRGAFIGGWMNFVLAFFIYHSLSTMTMGTMFEGWSPFCIVIEGVILGLVIDFLATKFGGEGKELSKNSWFS